MMMPRSAGHFFMYRMYGMPRAHGCAGAAMYMDVLYTARAGAYEQCMYGIYTAHAGAATLFQCGYFLAC